MIRAVTAFSAAFSLGCVVASVQADVVDDYDFGAHYEMASRFVRGNSQVAQFSPEQQRQMGVLATEWNAKREAIENKHGYERLRFRFGQRSATRQFATNDEARAHEKARIDSTAEIREQQRTWLAPRLQKLLTRTQLRLLIREYLGKRPRAILVDELLHDALRLTAEQRQSILDKRDEIENQVWIETGSRRSRDMRLQRKLESVTVDLVREHVLTKQQQAELSKFQIRYGNLFSVVNDAEQRKRLNISEQQFQQYSEGVKRISAKLLEQSRQLGIAFRDKDKKRYDELQKNFNFRSASEKLCSEVFTAEQLDAIKRTILEQ